MKTAISLLLLLFPLLSHCQDHTPTCVDLRACTVYSRSEDTHEPYRISIDGSLLTQVNLITGDSTVWNIHWVSECGFIMRFISGNDPLKKGQQYYLKKHAIAMEIQRITPEYYLYNAYRDRIGNRQYATDTLWLHQH